MDCRRLAYLSACGKYLQLFIRGASWLEPSLQALEPISYFTCSLGHFQMLHIAIVVVVEALQAYLSALLHINSAAKF